MCKDDNACKGFPLRGEWNALVDDGEEDPSQNMTCYKGGLTVNTNYQMCDVTSTCPTAAER